MDIDQLNSGLEKMNLNNENIKNLISLKKNDIIAENDFNANQRKTLVFDIDGTLCDKPINGDYSKCNPIDKVLDIPSFKDLDESVYTIKSDKDNVDDDDENLFIIDY